MEILPESWFMAAGGALISSPILIHLINPACASKRIRWAAMEFPLKSQKRNRRRLIIEPTDPAAGLRNPARVARRLPAGALPLQRRSGRGAARRITWSSTTV